MAYNGGNKKRKGLGPESLSHDKTPIECCKLQTVPEWYKWIVSESQQYKMLGNGWTVSVITHILNFMQL